MPLDRIAFAEATGAHLSPSVALRLQDAWQAFAPTPQPGEGDKDAARALAIAITTAPASPALAFVDGLTLYAIELKHAGELVNLTPPEAAGHPLLANWLTTTFSDALAEAITAGRLATVLAANSPVFSSFALSEEEGCPVNAVSHLIFETEHGRVDVACRYGRPTSGMFGRVAQISGDGIFALGVALRRAAVETPAADAAPSVAPQTPPPQSGYLH